jgi:hypothetical protein
MHNSFHAKDPAWSSSHGSIFIPMLAIAFFGASFGYSLLNHVESFTIHDESTPSALHVKTI